MEAKMKERCIYCGGDIYYQESMQLVKCDWCGQTMVVAKFENELARRKKTEEENAQIKEKLAQTEKEKQAANDRLFAALSNLDSIENAQGDTLDLLQALRSEATGDADVLSSMLCTLLSGQKDADSQLQLLQTVSDRILGSQNDALAKIQAQSEIISKLYAMEMDAGKRQQLANDFMIWMQNIQKEDTAKLQQIGKASGALLQEQRRIGDNVEKLRQEAADIQQSIRNFEGKWEDARLQEIQQLYHQAWSFQSDRRFDKADEYYRRVLVKGGEDPDVYWRLLMCHYCLTYQKDEEGKAIPIILNPDLTDPEEMSLRRDLLQHISGQEERYYQGELAKIDRILDKYRLVKDQSSYDVFISVKQNKDGRLTIDSDKASDLYDFLTREGLRVFNSRRCDLPAGQEYEPYIISALMSAKVLIVVGSSAENMNAQWVKNEWSRFQWLQKKEIEKNGKTDRLLLCYLIRGMQPGQIPRALNPSLQAICEDVNASSRLLKALRPVLQEKKTSRVQDHDYNRSMKKHEKTEEPRQIEAETVSLEEVLDEMMVCLLTGDFETVTSRYAKIKTVKPYMYAPQLHLYALCALHQAEDMDQLVQSPVDLGKEGLFKLAMRFSKGKELEKKLQTYLEINQGKNKTESDVQKVKTNPAPVKEAIIPKTGKDTRQPVTAEELKKASLTAKSQTQKTSSDMLELVNETALLLTPNDHMLVLEHPGYEDKDTFAEVYPAMKVDRGFLTPVQEQNQADEIVLRNPYILLTNDHLDLMSAVEIHNLVEVHEIGRDLLVIAENVDETAVKYYLQSNSNGKIRSAVVKAPSYGDRKIEILRDLAVFTNGTAVITRDGMTVKKPTWNMLESVMGSATTVIVRQQETFIINTNRKEAQVTKRIEELKTAIAASCSDFDKEKMTERLHNLQGRAAVFWVSGQTENEKKAKKEELQACIVTVRQKIEETIKKEEQKTKASVAVKTSPGLYGPQVNGATIGKYRKMVCPICGYERRTVLGKGHVITCPICRNKMKL